MKPCQFCLQEIPAAALVCHICSREQLSQRQIDEYYAFAISARMSGWPGSLLAFIRPFLVVGLWVLIIGTFSESVIAGLIVLAIVIALYCWLRRRIWRALQKHVITEIRQEFQEYKERARFNEAQNLRYVLLAVVGAIVVVSGNPTTWEFREYYVHHHPDAKVLSITRENHGVGSSFKVKLASGQEEHYTGSIFGFDNSSP